MPNTPTLWKYTLREVQRRPGRTLLTLLGIVVGVANVVAIPATVQTTRRSCQEMFAAVGGRAALEIVAEGQGGFEAHLAQQLQLEAIPGVEAAVNVIQIPAGLLGNAGVVPMLVLGVDPREDTKARTYRLREGHGLSPGERGLLMEANFARAQGFSLGSTVSLRTITGKVSLPLVGLLEGEGPALFNGGAVAIMPLPEAQNAFALKERINSVQIVLKEGTNPERVEKEIKDRLTPGFRVQPPPARGQMVEHGMATTEQALGALSVVALVGGAFVILNSFLMNLGERRRQLAILRAIGTTQGQVTRLLLREAFVLGVIGTLLGFPVGLGLAHLLVLVQRQMVGIAMPSVRPTVEPFLLALFLGPMMALASTWIPARQAGRRSPLEAILPEQRSLHEDPPRSWPRYLGLFAVLATFAFVVGTTRVWWSSAWSSRLLPYFMALLLCGCVLLMPWVIRPLLPLTARLLRPFLGIEGVIAFRQLERQPMRTSLTTGVLLIGVMVTVGFGNALLNSIEDIHQWYRGTVPAEFLVRSFVPDSGTMSAAGIDPGLRTPLEAVPGVTKVGRITFVPALVEKNLMCLILARDIDPERPLSLALVEGTEAEARDGLLRGEVVIGSVIAQRTGKHCGEELVIQTRQGPTPVRIAGVAKEYTAGGLAMYWEWQHAQPQLEFAGAHVFEVFTRPGEEAAVEPALRSFCGERSLLLQRNADLWAVVDRAIASVVGFLWILVALTFLIASMGLVNTLTMNVHEQTRELGVLRAIGLKRSQMRKLILAQSLLMALFSVVLGVILGIVMAYYMYLPTYALTGQVVSFRLHPLFTVLCALASLLIAVLAALLPARRAARLEVLEAMHYE